MRVIYSLLIYLLTPALLLYFTVRGLADRRWWQRWGERFGNVHTTFSVRGIVVHAASVGEVNAAAPLIRAIQQRWPDCPLTITCFTPTGSERIRSLFGNGVHHVYLPIDLPGATWRFLKNLAPRLLVIMETEIWPNLYRRAQVNGVPLLVSNARLTPKSAQGWSRFTGLAGAALRCASLIATQTAEDRQRFITLGADPDTTRVYGNLKFDISLPADWQNRGKRLRAQWGPDRAVLVAGSTHEADENALFSAFGKVLENDPGALLALAPRYPERFVKVAQSASARGFRVSRASQDDADSDTQCLVIDQMGVLLDYYAAADIAFVGGTLAEVGGHNPLEATAMGRPVIVGPNTGHIEQLMQQLLDVGAATQISHENELFDAWIRLHTHPDQRKAMDRAALRLVEQERGALAKNLEAVRVLLLQ